MNQYNEVTTVRQLLNSVRMECSRETRERVLEIYRDSRTREASQKDSLLEGVMAMPLRMALQMGLVKPAELPGNDELLTQQQLRDELTCILKRLTPRQEMVIRRLYLEERTVEDVASEFDTDPERIVSIKQQAFRRLRAPENTQRLRVFFL